LRATQEKGARVMKGAGAQVTGSKSRKGLDVAAEV